MECMFYLLQQLYHIINCWYSFNIKSGFAIEKVVMMHEFVINLLYLFILIHVLAATYHRLKKDGVWSSMVPFFKEK